MKVVNLLMTAAMMSSAVMAATPAGEKEQGIAAIKQLGGALKSQLKAKIKEDSSGVAAVTFCTENAEAITKKVNSELPGTVRVRRTALKVRNSANKPDETDIKVMKALSKAIAAKEATPGSVKVVEGENYVRVYKPLITGKVCLKCHGSDIAPKIAKVIEEKYPDDQAKGFKEGDLRGVIVAEVKKQ